MDDLLPWPMPIKIEIDEACLAIYAYYEDRAPHKLFDVRGWGHLTGGGSCNLDVESAEMVQRQLADAMCKAWNTRSTDKANAILDEAREVALSVDGYYTTSNDCLCSHEQAQQTLKAIEEWQKGNGDG